MYRKSRKVKVDIDYKQYHKYGTKVPIVRETASTMDLDSRKILELKLVADLNEVLENDDKTELNSNELEEKLIEMSELVKCYRHVHVELKNIMTTDYDGAYPNYKTVLDKARNFIKELKKLLRDNSSAAENSILADLKKSLEIEHTIFSERVDREVENFDAQQLEDSADLRDGCARFDSLLDDYYRLLSRSKSSLKDEFDATRSDIFDKTLLKITENLKKLKTKIKTVKDQKQKSEKDEKTRIQKEAHDNFISEQTFQIKILSGQLESRCKELVRKCDVTCLPTMSDQEIFDRRKGTDAMYCEMQKIIDKLTDLSRLASKCGSQKEDLLKVPQKHLDDSLQKMNSYMQTLFKIVKDRELTEERLKSAKGMDINLSTFNGYDSKLDIYSFRTEFEKLVQPTTLKRFWVDILKKKYLSGQALTLVDKVDDISEVWTKLIGAYGNIKLLLQNRMGNLDKLQGLEKMSDDEKLGSAIAKIINTMTELSELAEKHSLEGKLYIGGGLEKIFNVVGETREKTFWKEVINLGVSTSGSSGSEVLTEKKTWEELKKFLQKELDLCEKLTLMHKSRDCLGLKSKKPGDKGTGGSHPAVVPKLLSCHLCGKTDHVLSTDKGGKKYVDYFSCKKFAEGSCKERLDLVKKKGFCIQCLTPGVKSSDKHFCHSKFACKDPLHGNFDRSLHILVCETHKAAQQNIDLLAEYKNFIGRRSKNCEDFSKNISLICQSNVAVQSSLPSDGDMIIPDVQDAAIFALQTIKVGDCKLNLFFDGGCSDVVIKKSAADKLMEMGRAKNEVPGPIPLTGVGGHVTECEHGVYSFRLPLRSGEFATFSGLCLDQVTGKIPVFKLQKVENDIRMLCQEEGGEALVSTLPRLSKSVGGETDILIGSQYLRYHPREIWSSQGGLKIFDSVFSSLDGTTGVVQGPHPEISKVFRERQGAASNVYMACFSPTVAMIRDRAKFASDVSMLGEVGKLETSVDDIVSRKEFSYGSTQYDESDGRDVLVAKSRAPRSQVEFDKVEAAGTQVSYRCVRCRGCPDCKRSQKVDMISIQEEVEQDLIERCVEVDLENRTTTHKLPFLFNPETKLPPSNVHAATRIYESQVKALSKKPEDQASVIKSEGKLQELGFVDYLSNLSVEDQAMIREAPCKNFIPWRIAWNPKSLSTPCRMVFDASFTIGGGESLNSILAKGTNNMNSLQQILMRWMTHMFAFHTDIAKMYNHIWLENVHWQYQLYLWDDGLRLGVPPVWKVIKTAIYGVKSSGNVAECAIRKTAELTKAEYPMAHGITMNDTYVDDSASGGHTVEEMNSSIDQLIASLNCGGFGLKGVTVSGEDPPENLTSDGKSVVVGGVVWYPKTDEVALNIPELNFSKKRRGRKSAENVGVIPEKLTRRDCVSRVYEVHDPLGWVTPITAAFKIDLQEFTLRGLDWDDPIPASLRDTWISNFGHIDELKEVKFKRAVVPADALDTNVQLIGAGDSSQVMICVGVYARFKRKNGQYSCQLLFGRSKTVPQDMTLPRAELLALTINASTVHIATISLGERVKKLWLVSDSLVALHWATSKTIRLKLWVRNNVIEIGRLVDLDALYHVESKKMVADMGTRKGTKVSDVAPGGRWPDGDEWMGREESEFPIKTAREIVLDHEAKREAMKEKIDLGVDKGHSGHVHFPAVQQVPDEVGLRYKYSNYLIDPNKFRFRKVLRIQSLVLLFVKNLFQKKNRVPKFMTKDVESFQLPDIFSTTKLDGFLVTTGRPGKTGQCQGGLIVNVDESLMKLSLLYFFQKATEEVKHFLPRTRYANISEEVDNVLYATGRILPTQRVTGALSISDAAYDLSQKSFCVPLVERLSPIAYAITNEIHWYHPDVDIRHGGVESVLRHVNCIACVLGGRKLVKDFKKACVRCRILAKLALRVAMGSKNEANLCIAPAFYVSQVDICGPFESFSNVNKRGKVKVWIVVFVCCATGAVDCKVMEDYSTTGFILAFIRFSCHHGYPKKLLPDYGSQLIKGCKDMTISFYDLKHKLETEYGISFEACPVGAHYVHGKVERKIQQVKKSIEKEVVLQRLSILQWETLCCQIANSINNLPIGLGNKTEDLENLDLLTPNRLLLGRNNSRSPAAPLVLSDDVKRIIEANENIFKTWFEGWLVSYVPTLVDRPKWFENDRNLSEGDIVLFLKSEKEFQNIYQYGIVKSVDVGNDGLIRTALIEFQNHSENVKRTTTRGVREVVVIHPVDEIGMNKELTNLYLEYLDFQE